MMSDLSSMNRENKKKQLRNRIITSENAGRSAPREEDSEEIVRRAARKVRRKRLIIAGVILAIIGGVIFGIIRYQRYYMYKEYEVGWQRDISTGSLVGYEYFGSNVLRYTKDGASYIDAKGKTVWTQSYEMTSPAVSVNGAYAAIANVQGNSVYICGVNGELGVAETVLPISKVAVGGNGVTAVVQEDSNSSYINFFRRDGSPLDIVIKTTMSKNGYPLDIAFSDDATQMICSFVYVQNGELKNRVVFYDFSEIGKNELNRLVGGFDEPFQEYMAAKVVYMEEPYSCVFSGDGIAFFSSKNLASPELLKKEVVEEEILSVFGSDEYAGLVVANTEGENPYRLEVYKSNGTHVLSREFQYDYTEVDIDGDWVILYNENSCKVFNLNGVEKLSQEFDFTISKIRRGSFPNTLIVTGPQAMKEIKLH